MFTTEPVDWSSCFDVAHKKLCCSVPAHLTGTNPLHLLATHQPKFHLTDSSHATQDLEQG